MDELTVFAAFGAGFLSFISPCVLPLYPAFLSYITGMSVDELKDENIFLHRRSLLHTLFFLIGFSIVFIVIGYGTNYFYSVFIDSADLIRQIGAIFIVLFGLMIVGIIKPELLMKERRFTFKNRPSGYLGSVLIGLAFAAGWTPCTGPILGAILAMAASNPEQSYIYMFSYVLGFSLPFVLLSFFIGRMHWIQKHNVTIMKVGGGFMIAIGVMLYFDLMTKFINWLIPFFGGFMGF
ncbi:cytochrome c biogenesis protein CcdA [Fervidibacillus halotolerans]|uniref:Cytochrome c biogenesis protein CcdA n=1 Tax=Fervidibacillus halotolerans TaxID=2980027 RepID=A0A9E8M0Y9_9BACI|nr:cytochrome c biogenesis protein CcdA [Fervidibacillus halotolerans]